MEVKPTDGSEDFSSLQKKSDSRKARNSSVSKKQKKILIILVVLLLTVGLLIYIGNTIYNKGYSAGLKKGKKDATTSGLLNNITNPFQSVSGKVVELKNNKITVLTTKGEKKTIDLSKTVKVSKKTATLTVNDIKKDQKVTVFVQGKDDDITATRIVLRD